MSAAPRLTIAVLMGVALLGGCTARLAHRHPDLGELAAANRAENAAIAARADSVASGRTGRIEVGGTPTAPTATIDIANALVGPALRRLLELARVPYAFEGSAPAGRVTARLTDRPLVEVVNALLAPSALVASMQNGVLTVRMGAISAASDSETVSVDVPIHHLDQATTQAVIDGFLRAGTLKPFYQASHNIVMLQGTRRDVAQATALLQRADRPPGHVLLEALIVEFDVQSLRELGLSFSSVQSGNFSDLSLTPGNFGGSLLQFMRKYGVVNPKQFVATVQAISGLDKARVVARPYLSARSGQPAAVEVGTNRVFVTQSFQQGGMIQSSSTVVQSGVSLKITPTALPGDAVRVDLVVEEAQFIPTVGNAAAQTDRNMASTSMQVPSGQTIVIGGLVLDRESHGSTGVPLLRSIPILNLLAGRHGRSSKNQEVVIFVTPHIWEPGMTTPLALPGAFVVERDTTKGIKR
jgi:type II secretory pathway component GspD/PulD (secretin)